MIVLQPWVQELTLMRQTVLILPLRGPDGLPKNHPVKNVIRWYRRCVIISSFEKYIFINPFDEGGGNFTGPTKLTDQELRDVYFDYIDEVPFHYTSHLVHGAEIIAYCHVDNDISEWWKTFYLRCCKKFHAGNGEPEEEFFKRLTDNKDEWEKHCDKSDMKR